MIKGKEQLKDEPFLILLMSLGICALFSCSGSSTFWITQQWELFPCESEISNLSILIESDWMFPPNVTKYCSNPMSYTAMN
jgi:hypothetical protein